MMLAHSFKLLGLFLSLSIFASATPLDIDMNIVTSSPAALERRVPLHKKMECPWPSRWARRECVPDIGPRTFQDVCEYARTRPHLPPIPHFRRDLCPENYLCVPDPQDEDGDQSIRCLPQDEKSDGGSRRRKKQKTGQAQSGTSALVIAHGGNSNTQEQVNAPINWDIPGAYVSAQFTSTDTSYVVAPNNIIVGKLQGKETTVCKGDKSNPLKARTCYPTGRYDLKGGEDVVNFTMGLTGGQAGYLHWAAIPDVHDELR